MPSLSMCPSEIDLPANSATSYGRNHRERFDLTIDRKLLIAERLTGESSQHGMTLLLQCPHASSIIYPAFLINKLSEADAHTLSHLP
jgi:hypothetical protein